MKGKGTQKLYSLALLHLQPPDIRNGHHKKQEVSDYFWNGCTLKVLELIDAIAGIKVCQSLCTGIHWNIVARVYVVVALVRMSR